MSVDHVMQFSMHRSPPTIQLLNCPAFAPNCVAHHIKCLQQGGASSPIPSIPLGRHILFSAPWKGALQGEEPQSPAEFRPASYSVSEQPTPGFGRLSLPRSRSSSQTQQPQAQAILDSIHKASEKGAKRMARQAISAVHLTMNSLTCSGPLQANAVPSLNLWPLVHPADAQELNSECMFPGDRWPADIDNS